MKYGIVRSHHTIPISNHSLIHLLNILERTITELDDVRMVEMRVGSEERMLCVKSEVHAIAFWAKIAFPDWACKSLQTLQRFAFVRGFSMGNILLISKSLQTLQRFAGGGQAL